MTDETSKSFSDVPSDDGLIAVDMRVLIKLLNTERRLRLEALQGRLATALDSARAEEAEDEDWEDQREGA